ncbi:transporter substrate-binding domain-containing protein [Alcanivorax sp. 1008]|uniref:transporter substrate-binding domain-containing protein n=1 Tax=Alcanivorax sp. 1008 TaxID=2816853 RepID=UPI001DD7BEF8|nr:transporter substrate-binding domain-containing protein [Alcanivorax sp. 1008]MCC1497598.1 transporter substrate-binding domain-containing protein [Alcanivorax sp. 1008]
MKFLPRLPLLLLALISAACDQSPQSSEEAAKRSMQNPYIETGDLPELRERAVVRLLAPKFDEDPSLPRDGLPLASYRETAEAFVRSLGLMPQWIVVDDFDALSQAVLDGRGDLIVTNLTRTDSRNDLLAFSVPLAIVDEVLILPKGSTAQNLEDIEELSIAVPAGTAWQETVQQLAARYPHISLQTEPGASTDWAMLDGVASGTYQATIMDSDIAAALVPMVAGVRIGPTVTQGREIGWAMRPDNEQLQRSLNEYLTAQRVITSRRVIQPRDFPAIEKAGVLRVITSNNPASYFLWRGELMGFDYDLIREFARQRGLRVSIIVRDGQESMYKALSEGYGDVVAAAVTRTDERVARGWKFSRRYLLVTEQFVGAKGSAPLNDVAGLAGKVVAVNPEHSYYQTLLELQQQGINLKIAVVANATSEMLMDSVAAEEYDLTLVDSHLVAMETTFRDDLAVVLDLAEEKEIGWVVRQDQPKLLAELNQFIGKHYRGVFYNVTWKKYFAEPKFISQYRAQRVEPGEPISPWDDLLRQYSTEQIRDWRLLVSQMYQESRFDPKAKSHAGAMGLMQVMPRTAAQFGYSDLYDPKDNIAASMAFIEWLGDRFPASLPLEERIYFSLAAYNAGHAHVHDARRLARKIGKDPNKWFGNVEQAMLLLSRPEYYRQARYGYVRGSEPVNYVREIRERYIGYLNAKAGERVD